MRVASLGVARPAYYDRNATSVVASGGGAYAPHASTQRFTYTVPSGKKGLIEFGQQNTTRNTAATTSGEYQAYTQITVSATDYNFMIRPTTDNTVGATYSLFVPSQPTLYAGEVLKGATYDLSTGGNISYGFMFKLTVYDA